MPRDSISNQPVFTSTEKEDTQRKKWQQEYRNASPEKREIMKVDKDIKSKKEELREISKKEEKINQQDDSKIEKYGNAREKINDELGELLIKKSKLITKLLNSKTAPEHEKQVFREMRKEKENESQQKAQRIDEFKKFEKTIRTLDGEISKFDKEKSRLQGEVKKLSTIENVFSDIENLANKKENISKWNLVKKVFLRGDNKIKRLDKRIDNNYKFVAIELVGGQKSINGHRTTINGHKSLLYNSISEKKSLDEKIQVIVDRKEILKGKISELEGKIVSLQKTREKTVEEFNRVHQNDQRDFSTIKKESVNVSVNLNKNAERVHTKSARDISIKGG